MLHKSNHVISYNKTQQNKAWTKMTATNSTSPTFVKVWQPTVPLTITMEDRKLGLGKEQPTTPTKLCSKQNKKVNKIYHLSDSSRSVTWLQKSKLAENQSETTFLCRNILFSVQVLHYGCDDIKMLPLLYQQILAKSAIFAKIKECV